MAERAVVDWGAMGARQDRATDRDRATKNHEVNKKQRDKEKKRRKSRSREYSAKVKADSWAATLAGRRNRLAAPSVLVQKRVIPAVVETPRTQAVASIIPSVVEHPTATLTGGMQIGTSNGIPWSANPGAMGIPFVQEAIGTLIVMIGSRVVASMAAQIAGTTVSGLAYTVGRADVRLRVNTGRGHGRGAYTRPRGEGGAMPDDDADPYEQPSEWWEFWKWTF